ncbi:hypothetical protein GCM10010915_06340 [Microbacterium faecale]|uniref:Antitoxin n=1 Tax=Microbacterium faecale TaxID=1804630 RepID=A0A916Y3H5_9MICO|nr:type II toxin-antitoxin system prevent-host-death family antitoxin [Microbacterium faecale]GGD28971.1 hypothetical protein GCM10010915_06340 [Microbacterium faecale]
MPATEATTQVNMHEAKTQLSALVERVLQGETVTIARAGTPVVDLVVHRPKKVIFGLGKGEFEFDQEAFEAADEEIRQLFDIDNGRDDEL